MGFPKSLFAFAAISSLVATPALAGVQSLSVVAKPAASKDVRASTSVRKSNKLGSEGTVLGIAAAVVAGLGIAAAAGAFDGDDSDSN